VHILSFCVPTGLCVLCVCAVWPVLLFQGGACDGHHRPAPVITLTQGGGTTQVTRGGCSRMQDATAAAAAVVTSVTEAFNQGPNHPLLDAFKLNALC